MGSPIFRFFGGKTVLHILALLLYSPCMMPLVIAYTDSENLNMMRYWGTSKLCLL